jgi:hypothetical protein
MFEGARRPSLMARNAAIHAGKLPENIVAVLFIINLVIELLRGISRYLDLRKVAPVGFSILSNVYIFIMHTNTISPIYIITTPQTYITPTLLVDFPSQHSYIYLLHITIIYSFAIWISSSPVSVAGCCLSTPSIGYQKGQYRGRGSIRCRSNTASYPMRIHPLTCRSSFSGTSIAPCK